MGSVSEPSDADSRSAPTVTIVSRIYRPEASAASLRLGVLADALRKRGSLVRVLTTRAPASAQEDAAPAQVREPGVSRWPVLRDSAGYVRGYLQYMSFDVPLLLRVLLGPRADVLVCEPPPTTGTVLRVAAGFRRIRYVYYAADIWSDAASATGASSIVLRVVRAMERFALRGAARVLAVTDGVRDRVSELAPQASIDVVGHGVDLRRFSAHGVGVDTPADIVYVGSASEWHGAELAVQALDEVMSGDRALTAAFIGQGTSWQGMQQEVRRRGLADRVSFHSTVSAERAAAWLRGARVSLATLVPGKGYDFAVPTKLYASVAVGTPVAYAGPHPVGAVITANGLGAAAEYDARAFAQAVREVLRESSGEPDQRLVDWAADNLSAEAVAARAADAIYAAAKRPRRDRRLSRPHGID